MIREARRKDPNATSARLMRLDGVTLLDATEEAEQLARELIASRAVPPSAAVDAAHIAIAVTNRVHYPVTWNFRHIANERRIRCNARPRHRSHCRGRFRALQETSGRTYVRDFERLAQAATPIATQVSAAVRQMEGSLGLALERLNEFSRMRTRLLGIVGGSSQPMGTYSRLSELTSGTTRKGAVGMTLT